MKLETFKIKKNLQKLHESDNLEIFLIFEIIYDVKSLEV